MWPTVLSFLAAAFNKAKGWMIAGAAVAAALWYAFSKGAKSSKIQAKFEQARERAERNAHSTHQATEASKARAEADSEVGRMDGPSAADRLHRDWSRTGSDGKN